MELLYQMEFAVILFESWYQIDLQKSCIPILQSGSTMNKTFLPLFKKKSYKNNLYSWFKKVQCGRAPLWPPFLFSLIIVISFFCILLEISSACNHICVYPSLLLKRRMDQSTYSFTTCFCFFVCHSVNMW